MTWNPLFYKDGLNRFVYENTIPAKNIESAGVLRITAKDNLGNEENIDADIEWYNPLESFEDSFEDYETYSRGFAYCNNFDVDKYPTWKIEELSYTDGATPESFIVLDNQSSENATYKSYDGEKFIAAFNSYDPNDWLVSPAIKNSGESTLNFYAKQTSTMFPFGAREKFIIWVSEDTPYPDSDSYSGIL